MREKGCQSLAEYMENDFNSLGTVELFLIITIYIVFVTWFLVVGLLTYLWSATD